MPLDAAFGGSIAPTAMRRDGASGAAPFSVWCDQETDGGGWTVFQRRTAASDFYLGWTDYVAGFGDPEEREQAAVARDLALGLVTPEHVARYYRGSTVPESSETDPTSPGTIWA